MYNSHPYQSGWNLTPPLICPRGTERYTIQPGDTFFAIANKFNISVYDLTRANPNINPYNLLIGQTICVPKLYNTYSNHQYNISFMYPSNWSRVTDEHYEGRDGYFIISGISANGTIEDVCNNEIRHRVNPYGSNPKIISLDIENQEANLILPSEDQREDLKNEAALVIKYPNNITLANKDYNYFILWCDRSYIRTIGSTIKFSRK